MGVCEVAESVNVVQHVGGRVGHLAVLHLPLAAHACT